MKEVDIKLLEGADAALVAESRKACELSYAPYSNFHVGAAVLLENGEIVKGGNQENAAYPVGICAERSTLATAQNLYPGVAVVALALSATDAVRQVTADVVTPCGMCRQALAECERRYHNSIRIIMTGRNKAVIAESVDEILPLSF